MGETDVLIGGTHPVVLEELALLERVLRQLEKLAPEQERAEAPLIRELERLRDMLVQREDSKDIAALADQFHRQSSLLRQLRAGRPTRSIDAAAPYFAHMVLREQGESRELCLGRATCIDGGLRIVDWRDAPISKIFYRYGQGEEYEEQIAGRTRAGEVVARRIVTIQKGTLRRIQSPEGDFAREQDEPSAWSLRTEKPPRLSGGQARALSWHRAPDQRKHRMGQPGRARIEQSDKRLAEITGLIDPEQFELITRPQGFLVIRGAAGSGKTTVALHRVAYLAYDEPAIDSPETLVIVFSESLRRYVGHVLPALGLERVRVRTYRDWARAERRRHFPDLQAGHRRDTPSLVHRLKLRPGLGWALAAHVERTPAKRDAAQALDDWAVVLTDRALLARGFESDGIGAVSASRLDELVRWNSDLVGAVFARTQDGDTERVELDPEDDALLLRAFQLRVGSLQRKAGRRGLRLRHIVIDEIQDFSPLEVQVLIDCLGPDRSITLAGDTQQHIMEEGGFSSWSEFFSHLGVDGTELDTLRVSYRSTDAIMDFAFGVLGPLREDRDLPEVLRSGPPVELFQFDDLGACIAFLGDALRALEQSEPLASVAVLAPSSAVADSYYRAFERSELRRLARVTHGSFSFAPGIEVTELEQAKGLEFDYVILVDVSANAYPERPQERRRLHVGATRAVHQLWLTVVGAPSPLLREVGIHTSV